MEWKEVRLGDIATMQYGKLAPKKKDAGNVPIFTGYKNVGYTDKINCNKNTIVVVARGVGGCGDVKITNEDCYLTNLAISVSLNAQICVPMFFYYLHQLENLSILNSGSAQPQITIESLTKYSFRIPSLDDQHRITSILSSLDRKIELNNKINADLEEMAQAIFKNWFVDFEPFKDGKFVDSELGMIPEGWKVGRLDEIADVVGGSTPSKAKPEYYTQKGIAWLTPKDLSNHPAVYTSRGEIDITEEGYNSTSTKLMPKGTILFTSRAPIGYISIAQNDICTNQGFKSLVPKKAGTCFLYCFLKYVTPVIENKSTGSTFKEASGSLMKSLQVIMPEQKVFEDFETIVSPLFARIESLEKENSRLSLLRDTLLPRLMSGELEVPE